jgi:hypothetical protein
MSFQPTGGGGGISDTAETDSEAVDEDTAETTQEEETTQSEESTTEETTSVPTSPTGVSPTSGSGNTESTLDETNTTTADVDEATDRTSPLGGADSQPDTSDMEPPEPDGSTETDGSGSLSDEQTSIAPDPDNIEPPEPDTSDMEPPETTSQPSNTTSTDSNSEQSAETRSSPPQITSDQAAVVDDGNVELAEASSDVGRRIIEQGGAFGTDVVDTNQALVETDQNASGTTETLTEDSREKIQEEIAKDNVSDQAVVVDDSETEVAEPTTDVGEQIVEQGGAFGTDVVDIQEQDVETEATDEGVSTQITGETLQDVQQAQLEQTADEQVAVVDEDGGADIARPTTEIGERIVEQGGAFGADVVPTDAEDIQVRESGDSVQTEITGDSRERIAKEQIAKQTEYDVSDIASVKQTESGTQIELTDAARQELRITDRAIRQGGVIGAGITGVQVDQSTTQGQSDQSESLSRDEAIEEAASRSTFTEQEIRNILQGDAEVSDITNTAFTDDPTEDGINQTGQTTSAAAPGQNDGGIEADTDIAQSLTSGGLLGSDAEEKLRAASRQYNQGLDVVAETGGDVTNIITAPANPNAAIDSAQDLASGDLERIKEDGGSEGIAERAVEGVTRGVGLVGDAPGLILTGESAVEFGGGVAANVGSDPRATAETTGVLAAGTAEQFVEQGRKDPAGTLGALAGGTITSLGTGAVASNAIGRVSRAAGRRARTAGSETFEEEQFSQRELIEGQERFPGALDEQQYRTNPDVQLRQQAQQQTPDVLQQEFADAGVTDGVTLKKALDTEPAGPESRADTVVPDRVQNRTPDDSRGFSSAIEPNDERGIDADDITEEQVVSAKNSPGEFAYENPGSFVSSDLSRYFLGDTDVEQSSTASLRPGLPQLTNKNNPTAVAIRTDVEASDADTQLGYARELARREGETTAVTKPRGSKDLNEGEIEGTIPAGAEFQDINSGPLRDALRRVGIGSDYSIKLENGQTIPLRAVAPERKLDSGSRNLRGIFDDETAQFGRADADRSRVTRDVSRRGRSESDAEVVDNSTPIPPNFGDSSDGDSSSSADNDRGSISDGGGSDSDGGSPTGDSTVPERDSTSDRQTTTDPPVVNLSPGPTIGISRDGDSTVIRRDEGPPTTDDGPPTNGTPTNGPPTRNPPTSGPPNIPPPTRNRGRLPDDESDEDEEEREVPFARNQNPFGTDFLNPLTGGVLETNLDVEDN